MCFWKLTLSGIQFTNITAIFNCETCKSKTNGVCQCADYSLPAFDNRFVSDIEQHNVLPSMKWLAYNVIGVRFVIYQVFARMK